jgi:hypothetical protein
MKETCSDGKIGLYEKYALVGELFLEKERNPIRIFLRNCVQEIIV